MPNGFGSHTEEFGFDAGAIVLIPFLAQVRDMFRAVLMLNLARAFKLE